MKYVMGFLPLFTFFVPEWTMTTSITLTIFIVVTFFKWVSDQDAFHYLKLPLTRANINKSKKPASIFEIARKLILWRMEDVLHRCLRQKGTINLSLFSSPLQEADCNLFITDIMRDVHGGMANGNATLSLFDPLLLTISTLLSPTLLCISFLTWKVTHQLRGSSKFTHYPNATT